MTAPQAAATTMLEHALGYVRRGLLVVPLNSQHPKLLPFVLWGDLDRVSEDQVRDWYVRWRDAGIGVRLGRHAAGVFVLDVDRPTAERPDRADGETSLRALEERHGPLPATRESGTPSGGRHRWLRAPANTTVRTTQSELGPGLDTIADGGLGRLPPTRCPRGAYTWKNALPIAPASAWLLALLAPRPRALAPTWAPPAGLKGRTSRYGQVALTRACDDFLAAGQGRRNRTLNAAAYSMARLVAGLEVDETEAREALLASALAAGLTERAARATIRSAFDAGLQRPRIPEPRGRRA